MRKKAIIKQQPDRYCTRGLFAYVRCPAYTGEILFWTGNWMAGIPFYSEWWQWLVSLLGLFGIVKIMLGAAGRLDLSQQKRYAEAIDFEEYRRKTPLLFPWSKTLDKSCS